MEILDPNLTKIVKIEYNPCVICLQNVNTAVDFNTPRPRESETSESSNYFTNDNNESMLKLLTIDIDRAFVSNRSKNCFLNSDHDNDVAVSEKFRNLNEENPELVVTTEKEKHQGKQNKAHFYCDSCFQRNKEILRIYSEIEKLHKTFNGLRDSIEGAFKGGCSDDAEKFCESVLDDSDGVYWRTLRHQFAKRFKLVTPEENYTENQDVFDYSESAPIPSPSSSPTSPNSDFDADSSINIQHLYPRTTPDPETETRQQGSVENCIVKLGPTSTTTLPTLPLFPSSKDSTSSTSNSKNSNSNLKNVIICIRKLPDHIRPNIPVLINHSQTNPADLHRQQPAVAQKVLEPEAEPAECKSFHLRPPRNCTQNRGVQSHNNDHQGFSDSEIVVSDSDGTETYRTDVSLSYDQDFAVEDTHPPKKKGRKASNTKRKEKKKDPNYNLTVSANRKRPRFFCTVKDCKRRKCFSSLELLDRHTKECHEEMSHPFKCPEPGCERSFRKFRSCKTHIDTIHKKKYKYICDHCGMGFGISANLRSHLGIHTTEFLYKCPDCPKALRSPAGLLGHRRSAHSGERNFQCHHCGKSFINSFKLNSHIQSVHFSNHRPHICKLCGKSFPIQGYLYFHMRNTHGKGKSRGDLDAAAGAGQKEPQQSNMLGGHESDKISSKSTTTVMLPENCDDPGRIPQTPPEEETPVAPFYSSPLPPPLLPMVVEAPIPAPIISTTRPHNIPATTSFLEHQYMNFMTNLNVANNTHF